MSALERAQGHGPIEALVAWSVERPKLVPAVTFGLAIVAAVLGAQLRFDALPDVTGTQVVVLTRAPGLTPAEVERLVTRPIEQTLGGVPDLVDQRSISRYGLSSITSVFEEGTDLLRARQMVAERLQSVLGELPAEVEAPELGPLTGGLGEIYQFSLSSPTRTSSELAEIVQLRVAPLLRSLPGIVEVNSWGGTRRTMDVVADAERMVQRGVTLAELSESVRVATGQVPGATLAAGRTGVLLRGVAWPREPSELAAAVVRVEPSGAVVRVGDVAEVREGQMTRLGAATQDGRGETVYVMVQMLLEANALQVLEGVHGAMDEVRGTLPADVELAVVYDRGELVHATLRTVMTNLFEGGVLVVVVLFLMLGSLRAGALVASIIPLSMLGAVVGMVAFDIPGNLMSLGALDFGLLVDGAVVMVEAIFFAVHERGGPIESRAREATVAMGRPVFFSVSIILLVYVPILSLEAVEGRMFRPMAMTVVLALASALLLSLIYVPAATRLFLREEHVPTKDPWVVRVAARAYRPVIAAALRRPVLVFAATLAALVAGGVLFSRSGTAFVPQLDEGDLVVQTTRRPDIRVETAVADGLAMEAALMRVPEVAHVASRVGSPEVATDIMGLDQADIFVDLRPRAEWRLGLTREALLVELQAAIEGASPVDEVAFTQPIQMRFNELVGGSVTDVSLSIYGDDLDILQGIAEQAAEILDGVAGAADVRVLAPPQVALAEVRPRPLEASRHGLSNQDVLAHVQGLREGVVLGTTYDGAIRVPVRLRFATDTQSLGLEDLALPTVAGGLVSLSAVADVVRVRGPAMVDHEAAQRRIVVGFNVRGRDLGSVVADGRARLAAGLPRAEGVRLEWGGQFESLASATARLQVVIPLVLLSILLLLLALYRRLRPAVLILLNVPFAAVGGVAALSLRGLPISVSAAIGFIALSGIAVLNGVVLVSALRAELDAGHSPRLAAHRAAVSRLRPVLMTALVAALGFVPMMLATGVGAEVQRPLATVVVGGLVTSTLLTLVVLPTLYAWLPGIARRPEASSAEVV